MSNSNFSSDLKYLFNNRRKTIARLAFASMIIAIIFAVFVEGYYSTDNYLRQFSNNIEISLVLKSYPDSTTNTTKQDSVDADEGNFSDSLLTETINTIVTKPWTKSYKIISSEEANEEFRIRYGDISSELMPVNPFPQILSVTIKNKYHDNFNFNKIVSYLKSMELVDEVRYRDDFIKSYFSLKRNIILATINIAVLLLITLAFLLFQSTRTEFQEFDDIDTKSPVMAFSSLSFFIGSAVSVGLIYALKELVVYQFNSPMSIHTNTIIYAPLGSLVFCSIVMLLTALFAKSIEYVELTDHNFSENVQIEINE